MGLAGHGPASNPRWGAQRKLKRVPSSSPVLKIQDNTDRQHSTTRSIYRNNPNAKETEGRHRLPPLKRPEPAPPYFWAFSNEFLPAVLSTVKDVSILIL